MRTRTTKSYAIDPALDAKVQAEARERGISVSSIINEALARRFRGKPMHVEDPVLKRVPFKMKLPRGRTLDEDINAVRYDEP